MEDQQSAALRAIAGMAKADVSAALRLVDPSDAAGIAEVIHTVVPVIADRYGIQAGVLAAEWYDEQRALAEVRGLFDVTPAPLPDGGRYESMAAWVADKDDIEALVAGGVQRIIANAHRDTIMQATFADPAARGWARFSGGGDGSCPFCYMLISRGAVYSRSTARFGAHDDCNCGAAPIFKGSAGARKVKRYAKSARRKEDADGDAIGATKADQERAKQWISDFL